MISAVLAAAALASAAAGASPNRFVVQTVLAKASSSAPFETCLRDMEMPRWRELQRRGDLVSNAVYAKAGDLNSLPGPEWSHLLVTELKPSTETPAIFDGVSRCAASAHATIVRSEEMAATPNAYHPGKRLSEAPRRRDLAFVVEFIPVSPTKAALDEYREIMRTSIGPAMGRLVEEGAHLNLIALETTKVHTALSGGFPWNQIHIRGFYPDPGATSPAMTRYMEEAAPDRGGFAQVFGRLDRIRTKPRDNVAREIMELRLERP
jgi:hypothetical protein